MSQLKHGGVIAQQFQLVAGYNTLAKKFVDNLRYEAGSARKMGKTNLRLQVFGFMIGELSGIGQRIHPHYYKYLTPPLDEVRRALFQFQNKESYFDEDTRGVLREAFYRTAKGN
jgi:hypothetical protein